MAAVVTALLLASPPPTTVLFPPPDAAPPLTLRPGAAERCASLLRHYTVSNASSPSHLVDEGEMVALHATLRRQWGTVFGRLKVRTIARHSLVLEWPGRDTSRQPALLLISHLDVVPVAGVTHARGDGSPGDGATEVPAGWPAPPFGVRIVDVAPTDGATPTPHIVGRGALDVKCGAAAMLEAVDGLIAAGWAPTATLVIALGHDEEVGGSLGAAAITAALAADARRFDLILDEGGVIVGDGLPPIVRVPIALIGVAEKGYTTIEVNVTSLSSGHASLPPPTGQGSALVAAAAAVAADRARTQHLAPPVDAFVRAMGAASGSRAVSAAATALTSAPAWATRPLLRVLASAPPSVAALFGSTVAVVSLRSPTDAAAAADNVVPSSATLRLNYRLAPGDTPDAALARARAAAEAAAVGTPVAVTAAISGGHADPPSPVSRADAPPFRTLAAALADVASPTTGVAVVPFLLPGVTDSRHYSRLAATPHAVLRHQPFAVTLADVGRVHGAGERVSVAAYEDGVRTFAAIVRRACG